MDYWKLIVLIISAIYVKVTVGLQRFAEQPKYTEVNPGQDALLVCKVIDKRGVCSWQKDNKPVGIYPKKYEWASQYGIGQTAHVGGDCSLWVRAAQLEFDDGLWECQVTASDFTTQDALTSQPVRLVVRVPPQRPRLEHEGVHVPPGHNVTVDSGAVATVKCVSHYGNPPAQLKWFLGDQEISPIHPQTNSTEPDNPRTWSAASVVQLPASKERHGTIVKCLALHESYAARSVAVEARLDVKYAPTVRLLGAPQIDLEEGKDSLILRCVADANPPASIVWRRAGRSEIASLQESLQLRPVGRRDAGLYTCQAQNSVGTSDTMSVQLDVKYAPKILSAGPDRLTTAPLFSPAAFECVAEGNPAPTYKWVQRISTQGGKPFLDRGRESRLVIDNVTYDYQGEYECRATNFINGQERTATSDPIALQVVGAPQVLRTTSGPGGVAGHSVSVRKGDSATLSLIVCADPRPRHVAWEWGSLRLEAGSGIGRYRVDDVTQDSREDCYLATLHIDDADLQDQRPYYLVVENERGTDRHAISLRVEGMFSVEPLELSYLLGIAGGCLAAFLILICLCIYAVRARKCCFRNRNNYKTSEKDSEKADLKSRSDSTSVPPLDSIYTTPTGFHHHHHHHPHHAAHHPHQNGTPGSPEAMKTPNSETDCGTVKESLTDDGSPEDVRGGAFSPCATPDLPEGRSVRGEEPLPGSPPSRSHDRTQGQAASRQVPEPPEPVGIKPSEQQHQQQQQQQQQQPDPAPQEQEPQQQGRAPAKASDYGLERFNRLLDRLDRGNFLIKSSFKKSYSLILMSASRGGQAHSSSVSDSSNGSTGATSSGTSGGVGSLAGVQPDESRARFGGSLRGNCPPERARGLLIKANSSTAICQLAGGVRVGSATQGQMGDEQVLGAKSIGETGDRGKADPEPQTQTQGNSLVQSTATEGGRGHGNESDECCRSEVFDNDSGSGSGGRARGEQLNGRRGIHPSVRSRPRLNSLDVAAGSSPRSRSRTFGSTSGRRQTNAAGNWQLYGPEDGTDAGSEALWQSAEGSSVPTRFFQRQDYVQPTDEATGTDLSQEPEDERSRGSRRSMGKKRWMGSKGGRRKTLSGGLEPTAVPVELPFQLNAFFGGAGKRVDRGPQLKNVNLHFPNKTSHQRAGGRGEPPPVGVGGLAGGYRQLPAASVGVAENPTKAERKYFHRARSHFQKLGQKWRILASVGGKQRGERRTGGGSGHLPVSSYNLDDLIKATHRYGQENESANLSQKMVYKSYQSELDLTRNLAYLDTLLSEHLEPESDRTRLGGRFPRHKRAKSCSKASEPGGTALEEDPGTDSTLEAAAATAPSQWSSRTSANLIQLEDVWALGLRGSEARTRGRNQLTTTNTSSSSSEYLRNNLATARAPSKPGVRANKMAEFFRIDGERVGREADEDEDEEDEDDEDEEDDEDDPDEPEDDDDTDDGRMLLFDSMATFEGVARSNGGPCVGPVSTRPPGGALVERYGKNNATSSSLSSSDYASVYSATSSAGNGASNGPQGSKPAQFKLLATPEESTTNGTIAYGGSRKDTKSQWQQVKAGNNATNPFLTHTNAIEIPSGSSNHRIYNNVLEASPHHHPPPTGSSAKTVEKNHRLRQPQIGSPDRYDYRVHSKPSNSRTHFRQGALEALEASYQETYLEHYQNAAARAAGRQTTGRRGDFLRRLSRPSHQPEVPVAGSSSAEDLRPELLDDGVTTDELLLLVNAAIDMRRGHVRTKSAHKPEVGNLDEPELPSAFGRHARPPAQLSYGSGIVNRPTFDGEFRVGEMPVKPPASMGSSTYLGYGGAHRVIVSQSRKERGGEVVLEYEC